MAQGRSLIGQIVQNFIKSLKPKKLWGDFIGKDEFGTEYYEAKESLQGHKRPSRWFVPKNKEDFDQEIPPEWESWLRNRRKEPPTEEEIQLNKLKMLKTIENAKKLENERLKKVDEPMQLNKRSFPIYSEYETGPKKGS